MLLVMLALLGASLGFAELLVRHQKPPFQVIVRFTLPQGIKNLPINESAEQSFKGPVKKVTATWGGQQRTFAAFSFDLEEEESPQAVLDKLCLAMTGVMPPADAQLDASQFLAGRQALERCHVVGEDQPHFEVLRMTMLDGHVVAFGFSGAGTITEKDRTFFVNYCLAGIQIIIQPNTR